MHAIDEIRGGFFATCYCRALKKLSQYIASLAVLTKLKRNMKNIVPPKFHAGVALRELKKSETQISWKLMYIRVAKLRR